MSTMTVKSVNDTKFYIDGEWVSPLAANLFDVVNPATERVAAQINLGSREDVDRAVQAARRAFVTFSQTTPKERSELLRAIIAGCNARKTELSEAMTIEIGTPITFSTETQFVMAMTHFEEMVRVLETYQFSEREGNYMIRREAIGVCGLITPWNWPLNQVTAKVAPALAAGCTMVVKPSEIAPLSSILLAEVFHDAGVPKGVFNLVNGDGPTVGAAMSSHPDIDMVSFTGSTRAGILIAQSAANTVKRVTQELGGKSPNIVLEDADFEKAVPAGTLRSYTNAGQSCQAPTRMLVPRSKRDEAVAIAKRTAEAVKIGDPLKPETTMGPVVSEVQWNKIQGLIEQGIKDGATLVTGGLGRPDGLERGFFVKPTVFADVTPDMAIAREEIFGPVLSMITYDTEEQAVQIANDTSYGLSGYVQSGSLEHARSIAEKIRAGRIYLNGAPGEPGAPFGGYKQSGNGREMGVWGLEEYLEVKAILGWGN